MTSRALVQSSGVVKLVAIALGFVACKRPPTCKEMAERLGQHIPQLGTPAEQRDSVRICSDRAWSAELRRCAADATDPHALDDCISQLLTEGQGDPKTGEARDTVYAYVDDAFPKWSLNHFGKACPDKLDDLSFYLHHSTRTDPWGHPYKLVCGESMPPGPEHVGVMSLGPDGREGTADDIHSWK